MVLQINEMTEMTGYFVDLFMLTCCKPYLCQRYIHRPVFTWNEPVHIPDLPAVHPQAGQLVEVRLVTVTLPFLW